MATAKQIIDKALSYEGIKEQNGTVIFNERYWGYKTDSAWCATFVYCVFEDCGASDLFYGGGKCAYVPTIADYYIAQGQEVSKYDGQCADLILFDWDKNGNSDHIGLIISKNADGSYNTIEGNTSINNQADGGKVMIRTRYISNISHIFRPNYDKAENQPQQEIKPQTKCDNATVELGYQHALNFCGMRSKGAVLQEALNMDYGFKLAVDGVVGDNTKSALGSHYVQKGETQYMVTALEILLMINGYDPKGVECAGVFGSGLEACVKQFQKDKRLTVDGVAGRNTFLELVK